MFSALRAEVLASLIGIVRHMVLAAILTQIDTPFSRTAQPFLGAVCHLAAILGLGSALTLVCQILDNIKIDSVVVGSDAEYVGIEFNLLSGI